MLNFSSDRTPAARLAVAAAAALAALGLSLLLRDYIGNALFVFFSAAVVAAAFYSGFDGAVLVGHNIEDFDYLILRRTVSTHRAFDAPGLRHLLIDTYKMARRVLPGMERSLSMLSIRRVSAS